MSGPSSKWLEVAWDQFDPCEQGQTAFVQFVATSLHDGCFVRLVYDQANGNIQPVPRPPPERVVTAWMHNWIDSHMVLPSNRG